MTSEDIIKLLERIAVAVEKLTVEPPPMCKFRKATKAGTWHCPNLWPCEEHPYAF